MKLPVCHKVNKVQRQNHCKAQFEEIFTSFIQQLNAKKRPGHSLPLTVGLCKKVRSEAPKSAINNHLKKGPPTRTRHSTTVGPHLFGPWDVVRYILHGAVTDATPLLSDNGRGKARP